MCKLVLIKCEGLGNNVGSEVFAKKIDFAESMADADGIVQACAVGKVSYDIRQCFPDAPHNVVRDHVVRKYEEYITLLKAASFDVLDGDGDGGYAA